MANVFVPAAPVITSIEPFTFFGKPGAHISGTEDLSGLPSGYSIQISIVDVTLDDNMIGSPAPVNGDGTWKATVPSNAGDTAFAMAMTLGPGNEPGATSSSAPFTLP